MDEQYANDAGFTIAQLFTQEDQEALVRFHYGQDVPWDLTPEDAELLGQQLILAAATARATQAMWNTTGRISELMPTGPRGQRQELPYETRADWTALFREEMMQVLYPEAAQLEEGDSS